MKTITKKLAVFGLIGTLGFSLPGCGSTTSEYSDDDNVAVETDSTDDEKASETKYFDVGEHLYFERYYLGRTIYAENITGGSVSIPEGYSVYDIENFNEVFYFVVLHTLQTVVLPASLASCSVPLIIVLERFK